ncbi:hypothetical protein KKC63_00755, partial [Patescibacteria group bacterium]|nr:hypothetical protein [Patescibacteria group bacterium]
RTIDYIPTIFLFLPLIYAVADVINREKGRKITTKRVITLFLGMLFFCIIQKFIFIIGTMAL